MSYLNVYSILELWMILVSRGMRSWNCMVGLKSYIGRDWGSVGWCWGTAAGLRHETGTGPCNCGVGTWRAIG